jgi:hypothetical protein
VQHDASGEGLALAGAALGPVQRVGDLGVGVVIEEPVEGRQGVGLGLAGLPGHRRDGDYGAVGLSSAETDVEVDPAVLDQGDIVEEQPGYALAFPRWGSRIGPESGKVGGQGADALLVLIVEDGPSGGGGPLVVSVGLLQGAQGIVPVGFEAVGDEAVVGVDGEVAAAGEVGAVSGPLHVRLAQRVGFVGAGFDFGLDGERDVEGKGGNGVE